MLINLETMEYEPYPAGYWIHVASSLKLTDDQKAAIKLCWTRVQENKAALTKEHERLTTRLAEIHEQQQHKSEQFDQQMQQLPALQLPSVFKQQWQLKQFKQHQQHQQQQRQLLHQQPQHALQLQQKQKAPLLLTRESPQQVPPPKLQEQRQLQAPGQQQQQLQPQVPQLDLQYQQQEHQMQAVEQLLFADLAASAADVQWSGSSLGQQAYSTQHVETQLQANMLLQQPGQQCIPVSTLGVPQYSRQDMPHIRLQKQQQQESLGWGAEWRQECLQQDAAQLLYQQLLNDVDQAHETSLGRLGCSQLCISPALSLPSQQQQEELQCSTAVEQQPAVLQLLWQLMQLTPEQLRQQQHHQQQQQHQTQKWQVRSAIKCENFSSMWSHRAQHQSASNTSQQQDPHKHHTAAAVYGAADHTQQQPCTTSTPAGSTPYATASQMQLHNPSHVVLSPALSASASASGDGAAPAVKLASMDQYPTGVTYPRPEEAIMQVYSKEQQQIENQLHVVTEKIKMQHFCQSLQFHNTLTRRQIAEVYVNSWPYVPDALSVCEALDELGW